MLDNTIKLFEISLPKIEADFVNAQIISGCNAYIGKMHSDKNRIYSELEENSYAFLNNNDYGGEVLEVEIRLIANKNNIYI